MKISIKVKVAFFLSFIALTPFAKAESVSREPPAVYKEHLEAQLTPLEPLLENVYYLTPEESDHGCVLHEQLLYVSPTGRTYEVRNYAFKALSNGDLDEIGTDLFTFREDSEKIYLIKAETRLPDGTVRSVPDEGIMIQAHQADQDSMIFSGLKQLRIIYPQVTKDAVTHCIVLIERDASRIPDQLTNRFYWEMGWQTYLMRVTVELPKEYDDRLHMVSLGNGVPSAEKTALDNGRVRYEWKKEKPTLSHWEYLGGPIDQTGPTLTLSTLSDWDEFAAWYAARIQESSEVNETVKATAKEWAEGAQSEEDIIANLTFNVANEIRYVSLEFGVGGLQPQSAAGVLENRFGDCKDKANLLRVLLAEHGIKSYVTLLNTEHAGRVEQRCAHIGAFNHAILAVEKSDGELLFCDPTLKYGRAGLLYPSIANRSVLIIEDDTAKARWVQTPAATAGTVDYDLDLTLSDKGQLSGWFSLRATDYHASAFSLRFESTEKDTLGYEMERYLGNFYEASSVIDYEITRSDARDSDFTLKAYFVLPEDGRSAQSISWPDISWLRPQLGEEKEVQREAFIWNDNVTFSLKIALPESIVPVDLPDKWSVKCFGFSAEGAWQFDGKQVTAELQIDQPESRFSSPNFLKLFNAVDATTHWLEKLVILDKSENASSTGTSASDSTELGDEFILMTTGEGQVNLIDHLYPTETKAVQRRAALEKTKAWFPKDAVTQFECDIRLGWLAYSENEFLESLLIAEEAINAYGEEIDTSLLGWALYLKAMAFEELGQIDKSLEQFLQLEENEAMEDVRRGSAAYQYARIQTDLDPKTAVTYYLKSLTYDTYDEQWILEQSYEFLMDEIEASQLTSFLNNLQNTNPEKANAMAILLSETAVKRAPDLYGLVYAAKVAETVRALDFAEAACDETVLKKLFEYEENYQHYIAIRQQLQSKLSDATYDFWTPVPDKERDYNAYLEDIDQAIEQDDIQHAACLALWRILSLDPEVEFPYWIWDAARMTDYLYSRNPVLEPLTQSIFESVDMLPPGEEGTLNLRFLYAASLAREGKTEEALTLYQTLNDENLEPQWLNSLYSRWSSLLITEGQTDKAIEICSLARAAMDEDPDYLAVCIQGVYALLESGNLDEATRWIQDLNQACETLDVNEELRVHLQVWQDLNDAGKLSEFWKLASAWWPTWEETQKALELPKSEQKLLPVFYNLTQVGQEIGAAIRQEDYAVLSERLEQMMLGAKWHPHLNLETLSMAQILVDVFPKHSSDLYRFMQSMECDEFQLNPTNRYVARVRILESMLKNEQYIDLQAKAKSYLENPSDFDDLDSFIRYGALGAVNLDQSGSEWFELMKEVMEDPEKQLDPYAVNIMAFLYQLENQLSEAQELLHYFVTHYEGDNEQLLKILQSRLRQIQELTEGNQQLSAALNEWAEDYRPAWFHFFPEENAEKNLTEITRELSRISNDDEPATYKNAIFLFQTALDERLDSTAREEAFWNFLISATGSPDVRHDLDQIAAVVKDQRFSEAMRDLCTRLSINAAAASHYPEYLETDVFPYIRGLNIEKELEDTRAQFIALQNLDAYSPEALAAWMNSVRESETPIDGIMAYLLKISFSELCNLGAIDLAQEQIRAAKEFRFASSANASAFSLQLEWQQQLDFISEVLPIYSVLEEAFKEILPLEYERPQYADSHFSVEQNLQKLQAQYRAELQYGLYDHASDSFWNDLNTVELMNGNVCFNGDNYADLLEKILAACQSDQQYAIALNLSLSMADFDDPACREIFDNATETLLLKPELRKTNQLLLYYQYSNAIRHGQHKQVLNDLPSEENLSKQQRHRLMMTTLLASRNLDRLKEYLAKVNPDLLLDPDYIWQTLKACELCDQTSMFEIVKDKGMEELREYMVDSLMDGNIYAADQTVRLGEYLDNNDLLQEWFSHYASVGIEDDVARILQMLSNLREDWPTMEAQAEKLVQIAPTFYENYFYLGKAKIKQGNYAEGIEALKVFIRYSKDSSEYMEAQELLEWAESEV
ncbi:MAG: DUF3857 domain-containing protein [Pontiellaceae bacterium]|nr:DUF3857 domain-containing protein [Pontiellaceae bacterium]